MSETNILLDPSTFDLPSDYYENPSDYELWSLRAPIKFDISHLDERILHIGNLDTSNKNNPSRLTGTEGILSTFEVQNSNESDFSRTYNISISQSNETESFRILTKKQKERDMDLDEDDQDKECDKEMIPISAKFCRNLSILETSKTNLTDLELAPSMDRAPTVDLVKERMRIPYTKIDQKTGLKKRWNIFGCNSYVEKSSDLKITASKNTPPTTAANISTKRKVSDDTVEDSNLATKQSKKRKKSKKKAQ
jgi:hypothetical protein